jgi:hypothetical protein
VAERTASSEMLPGNVKQVVMKKKDERSRLGIGNDRQVVIESELVNVKYHTMLLSLGIVFEQVFCTKLSEQGM